MDESNSVDSSLFNGLIFNVNETTVTIVEKDITHVKADAIVSSDDSSLLMSGGVSLAIRKQAGEQIALEVDKQPRPLPVGDVVVTSAGNLNARYILHAITIKFGTRESLLVSELISKLIARIIEISNALKIKSIAIPFLGTGFANLPENEVFELILKNILYQIASRKVFTREITLALFNPKGITRDLLDELNQLSLQATTMQRKIDAIVALRSELEAKDELSGILSQRLDEAKADLQGLFYLTSMKAEVELELKYQQEVQALDEKELQKLKQSNKEKEKTAEILTIENRSENRARQIDSFKMAMKHNNNDCFFQLLNIFKARFDENDLREFCLFLEINYEDIEGATKKAKAMSLLTHLRN